jgi:hypothetical protein
MERNRTEEAGLLLLDMWKKTAAGSHRDIRHSLSRLVVSPIFVAVPVQQQCGL